MKEYEITLNGNRSLHWDWLNVLLNRLPYSVYYGTDYPRNTFIGTANTIKGARKKIAKDKIKRYERHYIQYPEVIEVD
jgi:hypothetical protein